MAAIPEEIGFMEQTVYVAVVPRLPEGHRIVGIRIELPGVPVAPADSAGLGLDDHAARTGLQAVHVLAFERFAVLA
ncbi:hypothetical protein E6P09_18945 (plasmid) [Haloferax mediterranei ATCC 33500]|uniref:Uncharacterized protein n=1 Tax=Haloferax mediterranei (strain ATCC 33500 / DSM 1411 / JCM 8866 / NBRC 14739 / NCIMB 2177 / R-4) TaxID=523841 RepID=I3R904_HALMT|nr:hypothetical protein [Haloferax mediterranei]AFK20714.1 hypothetical protein HFX_4019 [Haloferax mediterranei ATCC 33500]AHZ24030.1 hypothetical protein BM92_19710 [Haloferax mediterranei ATCC 33500]ELZ97616.1 hypothetical protein C439_16908 [Haloferax mediterranei ATCC 33500]MDX5989703.1 hypothetical protein [Haloferax mediterranei ATCC 33500]QCQ77398.1 hypothetical protein E6P09_18945 [Haloferax mediterranei ATCC 33500]